MVGKHVLVVDDEPPVRELLACLLNRLGHISQTASNGPEALCKLETRDFDLLFVDFHMPGMTGDQLALEIKKRKPEVPVVMITGDPPQHLSNAIDRVLLKPVSLAEIRETISLLA
jgi:CheY-like chemotaxis protein